MEETIANIAPTWDNAIEGGKYIKIEKEEPKELVITNWGLRWVDKEFEGTTAKKAEFFCDVLKEDGTEYSEPKILTTVSNPFKMGLRNVLKDLDPSTAVAIRVIRMGDGKTTSYSVKKI